MFVYLAILFFVQVKAIVRTISTVVKAGRTKHLPPTRFAFDDNGEWNRDVVSIPRCDVPFVSIAHVAQHDLFHVNLWLGFACFTMCCLRSKESDEEQC